MAWAHTAATALSSSAVAEGKASAEAAEAAATNRVCRHTCAGLAELERTASSTSSGDASRLNMDTAGKTQSRAPRRRITTRPRALRRG